MPVSAQAVLNFTSINGATAVIETSPETVTVGQPFKVSLYSASQFMLESPYHGIVGAKFNSPAAAVQTEIMSLSGNAEINTKYPVAQLISIIVANHLILDTQANAPLPHSSRSVFKTRADNLHDLVHVINGKLSFKPEHSKDAFYGSIKVVYQSFKAQNWNHTGFGYPGAIVLYAQSLATREWLAHTVEIQELPADTIKIEAYPTASHVGINPYAHVIVFPASKNPLVKTDVGTVTRQATVSHEIKKESLTFSGKEASAAYQIDSFTAFTGYFFDAVGNPITPSFYVEQGVLKSWQDCYGTGYLTYSSKGIVYEYNAAVEYPSGGGFIVSTGTVFAFDRTQKGIAASYEIPTLTAVNADRENVIVISRDVIVQGSRRFEKPPQWPTSNAYPVYSNLTDDMKPVIGDAYAIVDIVHIVVFVENYAVYDDWQFVEFYPPALSTLGLGITYKVVSKIPASPTETITADMIIQLNSRLDALKTQYGIA